MILTSEQVQETRDRCRKARETVTDLCCRKVRWVMSVPARPDVDPDLVIADSLRDVPNLCETIAELQRQNAELLAGLTGYADPMNELDPATILIAKYGGAA